MKSHSASFAVIIALALSATAGAQTAAPTQTSNQDCIFTSFKGPADNGEDDTEYKICKHPTDTAFLLGLSELKHKAEIDALLASEAPSAVLHTAMPRSSDLVYTLSRDDLAKVEKNLKKIVPHIRITSVWGDRGQDIDTGEISCSYTDTMPAKRLAVIGQKHRLTISSIESFGGVDVLWKADNGVNALQKLASEPDTIYCSLNFLMIGSFGPGGR